MKRFGYYALALLLTSSPALAEDLEKIFAKVNEYVKAENYSKAIQELGWAQKELEKLNNEKLGKLLPAEILGFKGGKLKVSSALGFSNLERQYQNGKKRITLSITGSGGGGGLAGLAALGKMGAMMGAQPGVETLRIDGRTANLNTNRKNAELMVFLESGSMLKLEESNIGDEGKTLKAAAEALQVSKIDSYLQGK